MEIALVLPLLLLLVSGVIELGRVIYANDALAKAVRDGARYAMVRGASSGAAATEDEIEDQVKSMAVALDAQHIEVTVVFSPDNNPGSAVQVQATYDFRFLIPLVPIESVELSSRSEMTFY